jgi:anti-sigma factor RsiW
VTGDEPLDLACAEFVEIVTDYLEGALDPPTAAAVERHLAQCPHCAVYLDQLRATIAVAGRVPVQTLSERARSDLLAAFRAFRDRPTG